MLNRLTLEPALLVAVKAREYRVVRAYLQKGAKGSELLNGENALHIAVSNNDPKMLRLLLQFDVDLSAKNSLGLTPIVAAARKEYWNCVIAIAKKRRENLAGNVNGHYEFGNALYTAAEKDNLKVVKVLLRSGAHPNWNCLVTLQTPLHHAVIRSNAEMVALLVSFNANPNFKNAQLETPVLLASKKQHWDCAEAFVKPEKFLMKDMTQVQLSLFYLFAANANQGNAFSIIHLDVLKIILDLSFGHLGSVVYDFAAAKKNYIDLRPSTRFLGTTGEFIKEYSKYRAVRKIMKAQSDESGEFVDSLQKTIDARCKPVDERARQVRSDIRLFVAKKGANKSRAVELLEKRKLLPKP